MLMMMPEIWVKGSSLIINFCIACYCISWDATVGGGGAVTREEDDGTCECQSSCLSY